MNIVRLDGVIIEVADIRFSPAKIPILDLILEHDSEVKTFSLSRKLNFKILAQAVDTIAEDLSKLDVGTKLEVVGFLSETRKNSSKLKLQIQSFKKI
ncbi:primosomal replication protein N [Taylorella equigenitalis]|uniref:Primosomal replication protein N n=3 Tax=Taylorella equigenitalis TaxID=29575 RepID=A0A654KF40_TAYEM|nr:primosomal replication protein N [Taylorella equigenitalis]ADU91037.1 hypothetical protein TEQUI_0081 [Taylorella equigenitalis MCE9]AFN36140.1 putative primosomal replication protein [Taylorella equigenitalis ATCC 35865]ASY30771.1 primosomal replication protein N [Taylorella equigenitalis]ASY38073.1 primosomal replication protein N [Taylorella equigenitalis]ASY39548.1 primosomal replication protein N [Taylorella equigenitalis]